MKLVNKRLHDSCFANDIMEAICVLHGNKTLAVFVSRNCPVGIEVYSKYFLQKNNLIDDLSFHCLRAVSIECRFSN